MTEKSVTFSFDISKRDPSTKDYTATGTENSELLVIQGAPHFATASHWKTLDKDVVEMDRTEMYLKLGAAIADHVIEPGRDSCAWRRAYPSAPGSNSFTPIFPTCTRLGLLVQ